MKQLFTHHATGKTMLDGIRYDVMPILVGCTANGSVKSKAISLDAISAVEENIC